MPGLAPGMIGEVWIRGLPSAGAACAVFTSVTWAWVSVIAVCCCCCEDSNAWICCSRWATRASSSFSFAVSAKAMPGATRATNSAAAKGRRDIDAKRLLITPLPIMLDEAGLNEAA